jgi:putative transposase
MRSCRTRQGVRAGASITTFADCFDNAVIESVWSRMQVELLARKRWRTRIDLANRCSSTSRSGTTDTAGTARWGWLSPVIEFEAQSKMVVR